VEEFSAKLSKTIEVGFTKISSDKMMITDFRNDETKVQEVSDEVFIDVIGTFANEQGKVAYLEKLYELLGTSPDKTAKKTF
jgi:hypothetical protein